MTCRRENYLLQLKRLFIIHDIYQQNYEVMASCWIYDILIETGHL